MTLSEQKRRALNFAANGGLIKCVAPGSNYVADLEYVNSDNGKTLEFDAEDVRDLIRAGLFDALKSDHPQDLDGTPIDFEAHITKAGREALQQTPGA